MHVIREFPNRQYTSEKVSTSFILQGNTNLKDSYSSLPTRTANGKTAKCWRGHGATKNVIYC